MKRRIKTLLVGSIVALSLFGAASAEQLEDGDAARLRGDYATAMRIYRSWADEGSAPAQEMLGEMYMYGYGQPQDYAEAAKWLRKAADRGYAEAQLVLGTLYDIGEGVPEDPAQGAIWLSKAADQGNEHAQESLGAAYASGRGVPLDYVSAYMWFNLAAAHDKGAFHSAAWNRDELVRKMTPAQIAEAQKLAREWVRKK
jgi:uncharacterized protein